MNSRNRQARGRTSSRPEGRGEAALDVIDVARKPNARMLALDWTGTVYDKEKNMPVSGVRSLLERAKSRGIKIWIITYNPSDRVNEKLREFGLNAYIDGVLGKDTPETGNLKTRHLKTLLGQSGFSVNEIVTIGDSPQDISEGNEAGVVTIGLIHEEQDKEAFLSLNPTALLSSFSNPDEILDYLASNRPEVRASEEEERNEEQEEAGYKLEGVMGPTENDLRHLKRGKYWIYEADGSGTSYRVAYRVPQNGILKDIVVNVIVALDNDRHSLARLSVWNFSGLGIQSLDPERKEALKELVKPAIGKIAVKTDDYLILSLSWYGLRLREHQQEQLELLDLTTEKICSAIENSRRDRAEVR